MAYAVLVTGGTGFLGSVLVASLLENGENVVVISRSGKAIDPRCLIVKSELTNIHDFTGFSKLKFSTCFHFAGSSSVPLSWVNPVDDFNNSVPGTVSLVHYLARYHPGCHLIVSSSAAVYGNPAVFPVNEDAVAAPISPYGIHKLAMEQVCKHYSGLLGLRTTIMRIFSAYGPTLRKQLLWDMVQKLAAADAIGYRQISLFGTGFESRDFIHSYDVAQAAIFLANDSLPGNFNIINVASGQETQVRQIAQLVCGKWGDGYSAMFTGKIRPGDPQRWVADTSLLTHRGFSPKLRLDEGIYSYVAWAKNVFAR
jgi:UDP-glucose 4-epimerase